jgi:transposase-like protein
VIDFIHRWGGQRSGLSQLQIVGLIGIARSKFYDWRTRYGKVNQHNAWIPRDHWIEDWERDAIVKFAQQFPLEGYRRLTFMMLDRDIAAVSPSTTYRVLKAAGLIQRWNVKPSKKGTGFVQPLAPHQHWHVDVSHVNVAGTFYYLCSLLDGCSRAIVHHELRQSMTEADVEIALQRALEKHPGAKPRIISDNGPQFIAQDFKEFVRLAGLTHVKTSPYYPQSNGKIERWHKSLKADCIRPGTPSTSSRPAASSPHTSTTTTPCASTAPSDTSPPTTSFLAKKRPSLPPATKKSPRPGDKEKSNAKTNPPTP